MRTLSVGTWCLGIAPWCFRSRLAGRSLERCYVLEGSRLAIRLARASRWLTGVAVEPWRFNLMELRDEQGLWLQCRVVYRDVGQVQAEIMEHPTFQLALRQGGSRKRLITYLAKALLPYGVSDRQALWRVLLAIRLAVWRLTHEKRPGTQGILFLGRQPWCEAIVRYASGAELDVVLVPAPWNLTRWVRRHLPPGLKRWLRGMLRRWRNPPRRRLSRGGGGPGWRPTCGPRIAVDYYGSLNLEQPERMSDLFFWQQSSLQGESLALCVPAYMPPFDEATQAQLSEHGIGTIIIDSHVRSARGRRWQASPALRDDRSREARWLLEQCVDYHRRCDEWSRVFEANRIKIYVTWYKYDGSHCPIADTLEELGGITAMYQRSYESHASPHTAINADLFFGFSRQGAEIEQSSRSVIPYHVTTGYLGDHRFSLLREQAMRVRQALHQRGARRILAVADENTLEEVRRYPEHEPVRRYYAFLLERVLAEPWFGLIIKPKVPSTLPRRLGPVAELLRRAEATGRCVVYRNGSRHSIYPPAAAALAADVMVHSHLFAGTAGIESALAGAPTLLVDEEGWYLSPLYRLGVGRVVFTDWETLWKACVDHWARPEGMPGFGDWSQMLDELDPFRDGHAAKRMGTYLQWLLEGFQAGLARETILADAAMRYAARWGTDKVMHVNAGARVPPASGDALTETAAMTSTS